MGSTHTPAEGGGEGGEGGDGGGGEGGGLGASHTGLNLDSQSLGINSPFESIVIHCVIIYGESGGESG